MSRSRVLPCLAALALLTAVSGCGRIEKTLAFGATDRGIDRTVVLETPSLAQGASCAGKLVNDDTLAPPPTVPTLDDSSWLRGRQQPGFTVYLAWVNADKTRLADLRRALVQDGLSRGYAVDAGAWNDRVLKVSYGGKADIRLSVQPFCKGRLALQYAVGDVRGAPPVLPPPATAGKRACPGLTAPEAVSGEQTRLPFPSGAQPLLTGAIGAATAYSAVVSGVDPRAVGTALGSSLAADQYVVAPTPDLQRRTATRGVWSAALVGRRTGAVTIQPWCTGRLVVRYTLTPYVDPEDQAGRSRRPCAGRDTVEPVTDPLPAWLTYSGQRVMAERSSASFRSWTARRSADTSTVGASRDALIGVASLLTRGGVSASPVVGPTDVAAIGLTGDEGSALLVVRPVCLSTVEETYVILA